MVYGIIGHPVRHSFSPAMHNAALHAAGLNGIYVPFEPPPELLPEAVAGIRALGVAGVNVTVPYKEAVIPCLDELAGDAVLYGAVNTIVNRGGELVGYNTDGPGFIRALREEQHCNPAKGPALVFGAGGSARAVAVALARAGCPELALVNRRVERAEALAGVVFDATGIKVRVFEWDSASSDLADFARRAALLVNCTPVGMTGETGDGFPLPETLPGKGQLACDLVYNPPRTPFLNRAARNGAEIANGTGMLLHQGALSFEIWTGRPAPLQVMRRELHRQAGIK